MGFLDGVEEEKRTRPRTPEERRKNIENATRQNEEKQPCLKEKNLTIKCMLANNYDKEVCARFTQNFKNCKDFWYKVKRYRQENGIKPYMPAIEDRDAVKAEYRKKLGL